MKFKTMKSIKLFLLFSLFFLVTQSLLAQITSTNITCHGYNDGSITYTPTSEKVGTLSYIWTGPPGFINPGIAGISGLSPGTYVLTVTDDNGSEELPPVVITEPDVFSYSVLTQTDCGGNTGGIQVLVSGGNQSHTINLEQSGTTISDESQFVRFNYNPIPPVSFVNYQYEIDLPYVATMKPDFSDVHFTDINGNQLFYWRESYTDGGTAKFWVLIPEMVPGTNYFNVVYSAGTHVDTDPFHGIGKVFTNGGLNVTIYPNSAFFDGSGVVTCFDENIINVLNKVWTGGDVSLCTVNNDADDISIRWEGWVYQPSNNMYYGLETGNTTDEASLTLSGDNVISNTSDLFARSGQVARVNSEYKRLSYIYSRPTGGDAAARLGYATTDPTDFDDLTIIPRHHYYYRNIPTTAPVNGMLVPRYSNLAGGSYTVTVSDPNSCPVTGTNPLTVVVPTDNDIPTITVPADYFMDIATHNPLTNNDVAVYTANFPDLAGWTDDVTNDRIFTQGVNVLYIAETTSGSSDYITYNFNSSFYENIRIEMTASQSGAAVDWDSDDVIRIEAYYNSTWNLVAEELGWAGGSFPVNGSIPKNVSGTYSSLPIRIYFSNTAVGGQNRYYSVSDFRIIADEVVYVVPPAISGEAECTDDVGCTVSYTDGPVTFSCYNSNTPIENEFYFNRQWVATDACGKVASGTQRISVGERPSLDMALNRDTIYISCYNTQSITAPEASDACSAEDDVEVSYLITDNADNPLTGGSGTGSISTFVFPINATSKIVWTATDEAGITFSRTQTIMVAPVISATITTADWTNICVNQTIPFIITPSGGSGSFDATSFSSSGGTWDGSEYAYSRLWVADGETNLSVTITDLTVPGTGGVEGGCPQTITSQDFTVRRLIVTKVISRD